MEIVTAYRLYLAAIDVILFLMMTETNSTATHQLPASRPARLAAARRKKAQQTREWRAVRSALGHPEARQVDAAIVAATSFCMRPEFASHDGLGTCVSIPRIYRVAILILMRNGSDREMAQAAIRERLTPSPRFDMGSIPSAQMAMDGFTPPPRRKDLEWDEIDLRAMKAAATPLQPPRRTTE